MAAALVGGAFLSSFVNVLFDRLSSPEVVNWIKGKKLDEKLLGRLKANLNVVRAVLEDAEQKQITNTGVKDWLADLEDAVYKADDLMDEVSTKAATQKDPGNIWTRFYNKQEDREMVCKIEEVIGTLEALAKNKDILGLEKIKNENMSHRIPSTSLVEKSEIYGRDEDKENIIKLLLEDTSDSKISVVPIVGMGGVGKTTLAQLVYNDDKLKGKFDYKAWVCVSEQFDIVKVTKTIIAAVTPSPCDTNDFNLLQNDLKEKLSGKKFLIVMDDMWNDRKEEWRILRKPFQYGNKGSKILVTTRSDNVASVVQTSPIYRLGLLSEEDCWSVFVKHAFGSTETRDYSTLEQIGRKIVAKCKGLPLAVETLGGLLQADYDVNYWDNILKNEIWKFAEDEKRIIPALRISYHYLPSYMKRCFVYCSLYPKDYEFDRDELILLWMAEDLLTLPKGIKTLEEIGCEYFNELVARSFFQPSNATKGLFVMHDLIHDLATSCAGDFYFRDELENAIEIDKVSIKTRHLSHNAMNDYPISNLLIACDSAKHSRTFLEVNLIGWCQVDMEDTACILLSHLKCLRVLSFNSFKLDSLPDSIGDLIHLRYLDLSQTSIVTLPESLSKLYNLQTLKLHHCRELKMLPSGMQDLVNLRHLDISGTPLEEMPKGMSKLKHLQFLSNYIVGKDEENKIRELGPLAILHRSLDISHLENVVNSDEASEARIIDKEYINSLVLSWSSNSSAADSSQMENDILDKLRPHSNLKKLSVDGYRGTILSAWLGHSSYKKMTNLTLKGCGNCWKLPSLGQLPSLKCLWISDFDKLQCIDAEFYKSSESCSETPFQSLETLTFYGLRCWQEWRSLEFDDAFPQLKKLTIYKCPALLGDLPNRLPALEKLYIGPGCQELDCPLPRAPAMLELTVESKNKLRMQELPLSLPSVSIKGNQLVESVLEAMTHTQPTCLRELRIEDCDSALSFPGDCLPSSLQELRISDCKKLDFPMQQQRQHDSLRTLTISDSCDSLTSFPLNAFPNLTHLHIFDCDSALSFPGDCLPSSLQDLWIFSCKKLDFPMQRQQQHHSLRRLRIWRSCDSLTSFPLNAFPNLTDLEIEGCENMRSLVAVSQSPDAAISSLRSLNITGCPKVVSFSTLWMAAPQLGSLKIWGCPEIDSFPEGGLPPNLRDLQIGSSDKLVSCLASMDLRSHGLTDLSIDIESENVKSFPKEGWLPTSLESLSLLSSPNLETLDCNGLSHLTSLRSLYIGFCDKLENMTGERLPASLTRFQIVGCPLLRERCRVEDPQIWSKISHIRDITYDLEQISSPKIVRRRIRLPGEKMEYESKSRVTYSPN